MKWTARILTWTCSWAIAQGVEAGGIVPGSGHRDRRRPGGRRRRLQIRGPRPAQRVGRLVRTPPKPGDEIEVLLEGMDDDTGEVVLSRKKADRMRRWSASPRTIARETSSRARSLARSRAGCSSIIGINAFHAGQPGRHPRPPDIADYLDREVRCVILSIDEERRNIVLVATSPDRDRAGGPS